ncbi:MAG: phosphonoacetaldehyde reductase, partial [Bacteroidales bacterium]|nr:phosphonoacetaldehyde reductase [Bacteroidales bacterium]
MEKKSCLLYRGAITDLEKLIDINNISRIFLVTGKKSYDASGARKSIDELFYSSTIDHYSDFHVNPVLEEILTGVELFKKNSYDLIVAVGGGTAIDIAKAIRFFAKQSADPLAILHGKENITPVFDPPLLAIPTTAGSGSEATHFAVIYHNKHKYSLAHQTIMPQYSCIDGDLTYSLPAKIAAFTGMDALCQAIESFWSVDSTEKSRSYSEKAIQLIKSDLVNSVFTADPDSRMKIAEAAHYAGQAINITKTTGAHAFSYYLTSKKNIPHGQAVSLLIDKFLLFNSQSTNKDISDKRGSAYLLDMFKKLYKLLGEETALDAAAFLVSLRSSLNLDTPLSIQLKTETERNDFFASVNVERL